MERGSEGGSGGHPYSCCAGFAYYSSAMQKAGGKPLCLGLGYTKEGTLRSDDSQMLPDGATEYQLLCIGFSAHASATASHASPKSADSASPGAAVIPYCEGIELITYVEGKEVSRVPLPSPDATQGGAHGIMTSGKVGAHMPSAVAAAATAAVAASAAAAPELAATAAMSATPSEQQAQQQAQRAQPQQLLQQHAQQQQQQQQQQEQQAGGQGEREGEQREGAGQPPRRVFSERFRDRMARNVQAMQSTLRNEGPLRLRSFQSGQEVYDRLLQVGAHNTQKLQKASSMAGTLVAERCGWAWATLAARLAGGGGGGGGDGEGRGSRQ